MAARAFIFDLDGVLWDSYPCYATALRDGSGARRESIVKRLLKGENIVGLLREYGLSKARFSTLCCCAISELRLYPGVSQTLQILNERPVPLGVVTNLPAWLVRPLLDKSAVITYFATQICAAGKPNPSGLIRALGEMGRHRDASVFYVGDTVNDAQAATNAGVSFAWASYGYGPERPPNPTAVLSRFSEVLDL
jgi:HAD superfamily hydrolase (TIGR01509 family)